MTEERLDAALEALIAIGVIAVMLVAVAVPSLLAGVTARLFVGLVLLIYKSISRRKT